LKVEKQQPTAHKFNSLAFTKFIRRTLAPIPNRGAKETDIEHLLEGFDEIKI